jgi:transposase-like protein
MIESQEVSGRKRRSREEIQRLMMEFESSGLRQNEFCRKHGLALSTLQRQLKKRRLVGGAEGVLYHKLVLARASGVELPRVVSEGEQRCLAIAAFFAELSTADDPSAIVFDDPVSSLG